MNCSDCKSEVRNEANFCPFCGEALQISRSDDEQEKTESWFSNLSETSRTSLFAFIAVFVIIVVALFSLGSGNGSGSDTSNEISVDEFYCSYGTQTASIVVSSSASETVNAFVTVGLYGSEGTLQHTATDYSYVEPGGSALINVSLSPYMYTVGDCRVVNSGY